MKTILSGFFSLITLFSAVAQQTQPVNFSDWFTGNTLRVDYFHSGNYDEELFVMDRVLNDGPWSGNRTVLIDPLLYGAYLFEVRDAETNTLLFSWGFSSIFGEWQTTGEAKTGWGTFHESVRFPWPKKSVILVMKKRMNSEYFEERWKTAIDPASRSVNPAPIQSKYSTYSLLKNGISENKVDIVILGDGYTASQLKKYHKDAERLVAALFEVEPFKSRKKDFNVTAIDISSPVSGVNRPHPGEFKRTPLSVSYSTFDSERYALSTDNRTIRDIASTVPYEFMFILINEKTYGGGGIYNLYATAAVDNLFSEYIFVHEFGHHFASLADEYYTSSVSYETGQIVDEPWEPNITALFDPEELKWKDLMTDTVPLPTPWDKDRYDEFSMNIQKERSELRGRNAPESEMEQLFDRERIESKAILDHMEYSGKVGAFEGAGYHLLGLYRPSADCIMFTRNRQQFCPVCRQAIDQVIDVYVK